MSDINTLAERHILESRSRLQHIDELMSRAAAARTKSASASTLDLLLVQVKQGRDKLEQHVNGLRDGASSDLPKLIEHGEGLKGALETVGLELEKALGAIF